MEWSDLRGYKPPARYKSEEDEEQGVFGFIGDNVAAGFGRLLSDVGEIRERLSRHDRDPEEWHNAPENSFSRYLQETGQEMYDRNTRAYDPQSWQYYASMALQSAPESIANMAAGAAAGTAITPLVGTGTGAVAGLLRSLPVLGRGVQYAGKALQAYLKGNSAGSKAARALIPDARTASMAIPSAALEAEFEKQGVIDEGLRNGMSREDAERAGDESFWKNLGIVSLFNMPQYRYFQGMPKSMYGLTRPTKEGLLGKAGRLGAVAGSEALEETAQEVANQSSLGLGYDAQRIIDSGVVGGIMGTGFAGLGAAGNRIINGKQPSYEEQTNLWHEINRIHSQNQADKYARKKYETLHGDELRRQSQYDAAKEQMRGSGIDTFMRAISGQESGSEEGDYNLINQDSGAAGRFQIMPENWSQWAQGAGLPADAPMTPENQERVARNKMLEYYKEYGNWRDVASKWYSGRAVSELSNEDYHAPNYSNGNEYPSIAEYVESVMSKFRDISSRGEVQNSENTHAYLGENGNAEGKYWRRQGENTSLEGAHPDLPNAVDMLAKWYHDRTGKQLVVTAGTNGDHASGEHSHAKGWKVDVNDYGFGEDGALTTPDGEKGYLADEFIAYGRSLGLGMNWEGGATNAHIDVALDGTQWDGNGDNAGGFNPNVSTQGRADELYHQRITEGVQREQTENENRTNPQQEQTKPLFDINAEDTTTKKLLEQFITQKTNTAINNNEDQTLRFFFTDNDMLNSNNEFVDTPANRKAILDRYGDDSDLQALFPNSSPKVQESPSTNITPPQSPQPNSEQTIYRAGKKFLDELVSKNGGGISQAEQATALQLREALNQRNVREIERVLNENNRLIQNQEQPKVQTQEQQTVSKNKPPENILPQPKLAEESRNGVFNTVTTFLENITKGKAYDLTQEQVKAIENLLPFRDKIGKGASAFSDTEIKNLAKILKQGGVEVAEPQTDINSRNQALLDVAQSMLPLKTRATRILQQAEKKRRDETISKVSSSQAEELARQLYDQNRQEQKRQSVERAEEALSGLGAHNPKYTGFQEEDEKRRADEEEKQRQREAFNRAGTHKDYGALADDTKRRREAYLATIGDPNRIKQVEESERHENVAMHNRAEREESEATQKRTTPEELRENFLNAQRLGDADTNARLDRLQQEGRKQRDLEIEQLKKADQAAKSRAGKEILRTLRNPKYKDAKAKVDAKEGLSKALEHGSVEAIRLANSFITETDKQLQQQQKQSSPNKEELPKTSQPQEQPTRPQESQFGTVPPLKTETPAKVEPPTQAEETTQQQETDTESTEPTGETYQIGKTYQLPKWNQPIEHVRVFVDRNVSAETLSGIWNTIQNHKDDEGFQQTFEREMKKHYPDFSVDFSSGEARLHLDKNDFFEHHLDRFSFSPEAVRFELKRYTKNSLTKEHAQKILDSDDLPESVFAVWDLMRKVEDTEREERQKKETKPEQPQEKPKQEPTKSKPKKKSNKQSVKEKLYEKYKAVTHPRLKEHIDELVELAGRDKDTPQRAEAIKELDNLRKKRPNSDAIDAKERELQEKEDKRTLRVEIDQRLKDPQLTKTQKDKLTGLDRALTLNQVSAKDARRMFNEILQTDEPTAQETPKDKAKEILPETMKIETPKNKSKSRAESLYGNEAGVISDSRNTYQVRYKVVEAEDLIASHKIDTTFSGVVANKNYPPELQPRDRLRTNMQANLISMANNLKPADLLSSRNLNQGAPVIRKNNIVLNGNGRTAAIQYAYKIGNANNYKNSLIKNAERLGLNADEISKMANPVLVRELDKALSEQDIQDITTSETGGARRAASEQAKVDANKISKHTIAIMPRGDEINLTADETVDFVRSLLQDIATDEEINSLTTDDGKISQDGINRVKRALFAKAYDNADVISRMSESTDDNVRGVTNVLLSAAPEIIKVKERMANGTLHKYDLSAINDAVNRLSQLREQRKTVESYLTEQSLFSGTVDSEETKKIVSAFDKLKRSPKKIAKMLKNIATQIINQGDPKQGILFGESNEKKPLIKLIQKAREAAENDENIPLFSKQGSNVDTSTDNFVADKDLTPQQKLLKSFSEKLGVPIKFVDNPESRFGGVFKGGSIFVNVNSNKPLGKVFWHESLHWLKANNPELFKQLAKAAGITDAQRKAYLEETERDDISTPDEINEEILADQMEDVAERTGLLQAIAGKDRDLIQRAIQWLKDTLNKFIDHFRNPQGKLTTEQATRLADEFGHIARNLVDSNGNKIFQYNNRTRNIEVIGGRSTQNTETASKPKAESDDIIKYSINNNSSESLTQKIKNTVSSWFAQPTRRRRADITENLRKLSGHRILYGYMDGADDVVVDNVQKLIQSRKAYDFEKLLPAVGKEIAKNLKLNPTQEQSNYIADWLLTGALNNNSAEAQAFRKAMQDKPLMADCLIETQDMFKEIREMTAWERVGSTLIPRKEKTLLEKLGIIKGDFKEQVLDDLAPLEAKVEEAIKKAPPHIAEMLKRGVDVKKLAQMARGSGAIASQMVSGTAKEIDNIRATLAEKYPALDFSKFKTWAMIAESVGGDWEGLQTFAVAKLSKEIHEYNRAHPNEEQITPYTSEADADKIISTGEAKFGEAQKDLVQFSKTLLAMRYDSGLLTDNQYFAILNSWKNYVPMARVFDENEEYKKFDDLRKRHGHQEDTWSPIQTMIANAHKVVQACEQNKVKLELVSLVRLGNFDNNISEVPSSNPDAENIIRFRENGKMKYLETPDPAIKRAVDSLRTQEEGAWIVKMLRAGSGFMRAMQTMSNPDFAIGNLFRDLPDAYIHNKQLGNTMSIISMVNAIRSAATEMFNGARGRGLSKDFLEWQMHGGAQASFVSGDVNYIQRSVDDATSTWKQRLIRKPFATTLDAFQRLSEFTENVTRLASYKVAKEQLAKAHGGKATITDKQLAALAAREASIDFSKAGRSTRKLNQYVLFANAAVQGINQWVEAVHEGRTNGNWEPLMGKFFRLGAQAVLLAALQFFANHWDDETKKAYEQAPNWEKDTYWIFGDVKIPKGMDFGLRFGANLIDEFLSYATDQKPMEVRRVLQPFWQALPSLTATLATPTIEVLLNKSYFRDAPIVPSSEKHLPGYLQFDVNSSYVSKLISGKTVPIAKLFGAETGWSPRQLDYLINGYLGFMGRFASGVGTDIDKLPMIRRFVFSPYKNPKIVKEYYEAYENQEKLFNGYKLERSRNKRAEMPKEYDAKLHKRILAAYEQMHKISKQEKMILTDEQLSNDERKTKLQNLEKRRVAICERVFQRAR